MSLHRNSPAPHADVRPFTARSVIASTLLGTHPPSMAVEALVRSGALFHLAAGTVRVALSRMVAAGELTTDNGRYALAGHLLVRQTRQDESRRGLAPDSPWDGRWEVAVIDTDARSAADRLALRSAMGRLRLAELREGVWMRPSNLDAERHGDARATALQACRWFTAEPETEPAELASRLWDLSGWQAGAEALIDEIASLSPQLRRSDPDALPSGFTLNAAVLRHLQGDPMLADALLPRRWAGDRLRARFERFDHSFNQVWRTWIRGR